MQHAKHVIQEQFTRGRQAIKWAGSARQGGAEMCHLWQKNYYAISCLRSERDFDWCVLGENGNWGFFYIYLYAWCAYFNKHQIFPLLTFCIWNNPHSLLGLRIFVIVLYHTTAAIRFTVVPIHQFYRGFLSFYLLLSSALISLIDFST